MGINIYFPLTPGNSNPTGVAVPIADGVDDAPFVVWGIWWACEKDTQQLKVVN